MTSFSIQAHKLIFLMEDANLQDNQESPIRQLNLNDAQLMLTGPHTLSSEIRRDLESAVNACLNNVRRVHLISRHVDGALLKEIYTRDGVGTLITAESYEGLREATIDDVGGILELIAPLEDSGVLVRRSREQLELEIRHFNLIERDGMIIACAGLYPFISAAIGELACLAVHPDYQNESRGESLLRETEKKARSLGLKQLFVLTTQTAHWFLERGFTKGESNSLPVRRRELYNYQRNSKIFYKSL
jgi:amino-acid N-acetyltransferase